MNAKSHPHLLGCRLVRHSLFPPKRSTIPRQGPRVFHGKQITLGASSSHTPEPSSHPRWRSYNQGGILPATFGVSSLPSSPADCESDP